MTWTGLIHGPIQGRHSLAWSGILLLIAFEVGRLVDSISKRNYPG